MGNGIHQKFIVMDLRKLQQEMDSIGKMGFARKTDKQLWSYEYLSELHKSRCNGKQPSALQIFNNVENRKCKLTKKIVREIREKYKPNVYGKLRLAQEYGVSKTLIHKIIKGDSWKIDSG